MVVKDSAVRAADAVVVAGCRVMFLKMHLTVERPKN